MRPITRLKTSSIARLLALLAGFLLLATVYNAISTPFEAPDEIGHFYYTMYMLQHRRLPVVPAAAPPPNYEHEGIQPPLYYASAALFTRALAVPLGLDLSAEALGAPLDKNPHTVCGRAGAWHNAAYLAHDPHEMRFPYTGRVRVLHVVRLWSSFLATATIAGIFATARAIFPQRLEIAWLAAVLTALTPEFLFTAGAASNDNLVTALATWCVYVAVRTLQRGATWRRTLLIGVLAGLATLSKFSGVMLFPLAGLAIFLVEIKPAAASDALAIPVRVRDRLLTLLRHAALLLAIFGALTGWWFLRNYQLYGDLTGTAPMLAQLPLREHVSVWTLIRELPGLFQSWWGVFGCTKPPLGFYFFYAVIVAGGLAGLARDGRALWREYAFEVVLLLLWLALMLIAYVRWNWVIHAPKGRLLYPTMVTIACALGYGWRVWTRRMRWLTGALIGAMALVAVAMPFAVMLPPVAPPPIYADAADVAPQHPMVHAFGSEITLLGYDLSARSFEPDEVIDVTLYWRVEAQPEAHHSLALQLVSAVPGEESMLSNFNTWTGGGIYPTGFWRPGEVIVDAYRWRLPGFVPYAQGWELTAVLYDLETGERLGDPAQLGLVRVGASDPARNAPSPEQQLDDPVDFGQAIRLEGFEMTPAGDDQLRVVLWWRATAPLPTDLTTFVHIYDAEGALLVTGDGPPLNGGFPTSLWAPGDYVPDVRTLDLPAEAARPLRLGVGWYHPETGERLPAVADDTGAPLPDAAFYQQIPRSD